MNADREFGKLGEESATSFLCGKGFTIIGRNVRLDHKETDIIAKNDKYIVFVEVKTRRAYPSIMSTRPRPAAAVDYKKRKNLTEGAKKYLKKYKDVCEGLQPRIDVIEVYASPDGDKYKVLKIIHMENAVR